MNYYDGSWHRETKGAPAKAPWRQKRRGDKGVWGWKTKVRFMGFGDRGPSVMDAKFLKLSGTIWIRHHLPFLFVKDSGKAEEDLPA